MRKGALARVSLACGCLTACTSAPPPRGDVLVAPATAPTPPTPSADIEVIAAAAPPELILDGDLREWPSLAMATRRRGPGASRLAFAITNETLVVAAQLGSAARAGLWLGLASPAPELPAIGLTGAHGDVAPLDCEHEQRLSEGEYTSTARYKERSETAAPVATPGASK